MKIDDRFEVERVMSMLNCKQPSKMYEISECGCWLWKGYAARGTSPQVGVGGRRRSLTRYVYERLVGAVSPSVNVVHTCGQSLCFNPGHLVAANLKHIGGIVVDVCDEWLLYKYSWRIDCDALGRRYVFRLEKKDGNQRKIYLHRVITGAEDGQVVDHINGDGRDNRRSNLRVCTNTENCRNSVSRRGRSKYKGVQMDIRTGRWFASIVVNRKFKRLGTYATEYEAAEKYNEAAIHHFGEYAKLNELGG